MPKTCRKYRGGSTRTPRSSRKSSSRRSSSRRSSSIRRSSGKRSSGHRSSSRRSSGKRSSGKSPESPWIQERRNKPKRTSPEMSPIFKKRMTKKKELRDAKKDYFLTQGDLMDRVKKKKETGNYRSKKELKKEYEKISKMGDMPGVGRMSELAKKLAEGNYLD